MYPVFVDDREEIIGINYISQRNSSGYTLPNGDIVQMKVPSEYKCRIFNLVFDQLKLDNNVSFEVDQSQGCQRTLTDTWKFFFKFFVTTKNAKYLSPFHELHQTFNNDHTFTNIQTFNNNKRYVTGANYQVSREWIWDDIHHKWFVEIDIFNTLSTDTFAGPHPSPQKTYVQLFQHIFNKGLDQFCLIFFCFYYIRNYMY